MNETTNRAMKAIGRYMELKGCEILEEGWAHGDDKADYIIEDGGELALVFGHVHGNAGAGIPDERIDRKAFERLAAAYLAEHPEFADCAVRADSVAVLVLSENRAMIRHCVNALSACGLDLLPQPPPSVWHVTWRKGLSYAQPRSYM